MRPSKLFFCSRGDAPVAVLVFSLPSGLLCPRVAAATPVPSLLWSLTGVEGGGSGSGSAGGALVFLTSVKKIREFCSCRNVCCSEWGEEEEDVVAVVAVEEVDRLDLERPAEATVVLLEMD